MADQTRSHLEQYYDTVPRRVARAEDFGPLTLFVRSGAGFDFYARPTRGHPGPIANADVERVLARQRELDLPRSLEWVAETTPGLAAVAESAGLEVHAHPLLVHDPARAEPVGAGTAGTATAQVLGAEHPLLAVCGAAQNLGFSSPGTALGTVGRAELRRAAAEPDAVTSGERLAEAIADGRMVVTAVVEDDLVLAAGAHIPLGDTSEIVGVATLPSERRRGLGAAVTAALLADAMARGVGTVFLSAGDEDVARIYRRLGFVDVGTALIADGP